MFQYVILLPVIHKSNAAASWRERAAAAGQLVFDGIDILERCYSWHPRRVSVLVSSIKTEPQHMQTGTDFCPRSTHLDGQGLWS